MPQILFGGITNFIWGHKKKSNIIYSNNKASVSIAFAPTETSVTPEMFAEILCDDLDLNPVNFVPAIAQVIRSQLDAYQAETVEVVDEKPADQRVILKVTTGLNIGPILARNILNYFDPVYPSSQYFKLLCPCLTQLEDSNPRLRLTFC